MAMKIGRKDLSSDINELLDLVESYKEINESLMKEIRELKQSIPANLSQLNNDTGFITAEDESITSKAPIYNPDFLGTVCLGSRELAFAHDIPTKLSQLDNDTEFITANNEAITSKASIKDPKFIGSMTLNNLNIARVKDIPTKLSQLDNDTKFITVDNEVIKSKAQKATSGFNTSIGNKSNYPFTVYGEESKAAGITFDRGKCRVNFGLDKDNKLKLGGGNTDNLREIIDSENILESLFEKGLYLFTVDDNGIPVIIYKNRRFALTYNEVKKTFVLKELPKKE